MRKTIKKTYVSDAQCENVNGSALTVGDCAQSLTPEQQKKLIDSIYGLMWAMLAMDDAEGEIYTFQTKSRKWLFKRKVVNKFQHFYLQPLREYQLPLQEDAYSTSANAELVTKGDLQELYTYCKHAGNLAKARSRVCPDHD